MQLLLQFSEDVFVAEEVEHGGGKSAGRGIDAGEDDRLPIVQQSLEHALLRRDACVSQCADDHGLICATIRLSSCEVVGCFQGSLLVLVACGEDEGETVTKQAHDGQGKGLH